MLNLRQAVQVCGLSISVLALSGCLDISGTFVAKNKLVFTQSGFLGSTHKVEVPAGQGTRVARARRPGQQDDPPS